MSPVKIDGAKRQLFSLIKSQNTKLLEAAQKKKKAHTLPFDTQDAAEAAAELPEADAAGMKEEEGGSEQPAATGQKKKKTPQTKKEKSGPVEAEGGESMGQPMKRKRKDDSDIKVTQLILYAEWWQERSFRNVLAVTVSCASTWFLVSIPLIATLSVKHRLNSVQIRYMQPSLIVCVACMHPLTAGKCE